MESTPVKPLKPAAPWLGGKSKLAPVIVPLIENIPHTTYIEPFFGMGAIFFARAQKVKSEVINDRSGELYNFFRQLQQHYLPLLDYMKHQLTFRSEFERLVGLDPLKLTEIQRAARFIYLQKTAFGGKTSGQTFGVSPGRSSRFDITALAENLELLHQRLSAVTIENLGWDHLVDRYDHAGVLFYMDPPYYDCEDDYGLGLFSKDDFTLMADRLSCIDGRFIISLNDVPEVREIFAGYTIRAVRTTYTIARGEAKQVGEVLVSNGPIEDPQPDLLTPPADTPQETPL